MAKVLEVESGTDFSTTSTNPEEKKKNETEQILERTMKKAYVFGLQNGVRTMCISVLSQLNQTKQMNPQKQLNLIREMCKKNIQNQNNAQDNSGSSEAKETNNKKENES